jgi:hypothetical protein
VSKCVHVALFTGSRGWEDISTVIDVCSTMAQPLIGIVGDADGFDFQVRKILNKLYVPCLMYKADWKRYHNGAGPKRNGVMVSVLERFRQRGFSCYVVAGWDGKSSGTKNCIKQAEDKNFSVFRLAYYPKLNGG